MTKYTSKQICGTVMVIIGLAYLLLQGLIMAIDSCSYM